MSKFWSTFGIVFLHIISISIGENVHFINSKDPTEEINSGTMNNAQNIKPSISKRSTFNIQNDNTIYYIAKKPKISTPLKNMKVLKDQQAIFICGSNGNPVPSIQWLVNENRDIPKRYTVKHVSSQKSILRLDPVMINDDRSRITCQTSSQMGSSYSIASLTVYKRREEIPLGFPNLVSKSSVIVNEKNTRVVLECKVNGNPKPEIVWLRDSIPLDLENPRIKLLSNGDLEINKTLEEDEGAYECMATNSHGTIVSPIIRLMIRVSYFSPHFVYVPNDQVVTPGSTLNLKCRALGNPIPSVYWKCGQTILQPHSFNSTFPKPEANVVLSDLSESLKCTCVAKNSKETISRSILITIQEPSIAPANIKIGQISATTCVLKWAQKIVQEEEIKYQVFIIKTTDLPTGKNIKTNVIVKLRKTDAEMDVITKLSNLIPFTNYTVWLEPYPSQIDSVKSNLVSFTTLELPPNSPPRNVELSAISNGALNIMWDPPESPNGIITSYSIYYTQYPKIALSQWDKYNVKVDSISDSRHQTILTHLLNNVTYSVSISAQNGAGSGPVSEQQKILVRAGVVQGPKNFKAIAKSSTEIQLFWDPIISKSQMNVESYQLMYMPKLMMNERIQNKWRYSPTQNTISINNLKPNTTYVFHLWADTASANGMTSIVECTTSTKAFEEPIVVIARVINSTSIEVLWKTTAETRKRVQAYRIQCRQFNGAASSKDFKDVYLKNSSIIFEKKGGTGRYLFTKLSENSQYQIYLNTITRLGSGSIFKSDIVKTWPKKLDKPKYLHLRLSCSINHPCVKLEWKSENKDQTSIKGYRIKYYPLKENAEESFKIFERNITKTYFETSSLDHYQGFRYEFKVAAFSEYEIGEESTDQIFILEGTPSISPHGFKLKTSSNTSPTSVEFKWDKPPQHTLNGRFERYEVWCFIIAKENETASYHNSTIESITIRSLIENENYVCRVRVWIQKSAGSWSEPIYFKTKDALLPPPEEIRFIRLSHKIAHITWKWKPDYLLYYSHFIIYYANEKNITDKTIWLSKPTKAAFTRYVLKSLNETVTYSIRISSFSRRGLEGLHSDIVKEVYLSSESWPEKFVNQLSCAPDSSTTIQLRWSAAFDNQDISHFRVNFTGVTEFQSDLNMSFILRDEQEQSALVFNQNKYYSHQIKQLKPNTKYTISIEPIFKPGSIMIGTLNQTICTTFRYIPSFIDAVGISSIDNKTNLIELLINRPNLENGSIDNYYIVVKVVKNSKQIIRKRRHSDTIQIEELIKNSTSDDTSKYYITMSLKHNEIFPLSAPTKLVHRVLVGSGSVDGQFKNRKLQRKLFYQFRILACIGVRESQKVKHHCQSSMWSNPINTDSYLLPKRNISNNNMVNKNSFKQLSKGPSTFTTTTVVVILGIVIVAVLSMSIFLFLKRRQLLNSKLGNVYSSHSSRMSKEKSICMEHLLKEPLVDSSVRISTSGSLRFKNHSHNYLDINKIQLSSTPDLLVRSTVPQPLNSLVQFHGQSRSNRHFEYAPIPIDALAEHVAVLKENDGKLFNKEYESIEPGQQFTWNSSNMEVNRLKNRYANVIAYDHSRVVLQPLVGQLNNNSNETSIIPGSDYINANFINGYLNPNAYIATQGPLAETIGDFWRMMWEQNTSVIVMMTRLEERDRAKCDQYWPLGGKGSIATYSYINVTIVDVIELAYYTIRRFHIQKLNENNIREVYQLQFTAWPDHGVPNHPAPLLMFLRRVHSEIPRNCGPIVVHCSAGVGRTGAFIVIDYMLERLRYENTVDIYNYVTNIRAQRNYMVQTEDQYIFIYETLLEAVQCGNTEVPVSELANHIEKLNQIEITHKTVDGIQMTGLQMEFENLVLSSEGFLQGIRLNANNHSHCSTPSTTHGNLVTNYQPLTYETATQMVNQMKNRIIQILPPDFSRVNICPIRGVEGSDYINASWIDGYRSRRAYIAAQSPLPETCEDFWRTLWEHNSSIVVMLTQLKENNRERCYQYWPFKRSSRYQFFIVDPVAEYNMTTYIIREFKLTDTRDSQSRVIRQFQFIDWQESESIPHSTQVFLDLINQVHKTKVQLGQDGPITVHCSAGTGRTGIFLALSNIIERMKNESVIDLFQTVKLLRWQRPALLQTEDQYQFCYTAALEYLKIFEQMRFDL